MTTTTTTPTPQTPWREHLHERHRDNDLARGGLNAVEVFGQSISAAGPSIAIAGTLPVAYFTAGVGSIFSIVLGTLIVLMVAVVVAQFARAHASAGSLYSYVAEGLGPWAGFASGWGLALGYTGIASACAGGVALFGGAFLDELGLPGSSTPVLLGLLVAAVALAVVVTIRGVKLSTHLAAVGVLCAARPGAGVVRRGLDAAEGPGAARGHVQPCPRVHDRRRDRRDGRRRRPGVAGLTARSSLEGTWPARGRRRR